MAVAPASLHSVDGAVAGPSDQPGRDRLFRHTWTTDRQRRSADRDHRTLSLLAEAGGSPDHAARRDLHEQAVVLNQSLALGVARKYHNRGMDAEDIDQVALLGLWKAVIGFQPLEGASFAAYAVPTVTGEVKRHFRDHAWLVRPIRSVQEQSLAVKEAAGLLRQRLQREPSASELAEHVGITEDEVQRARVAEHGYRATSLDAVAPGGTRTLGDLLGDGDDPYDVVDTRMTLQTAIEQLGERDRRILQLRFLEGMTQEQVGRQLGISQMHVSRLLTRLVDRLDRTVQAAS